MYIFHITLLIANVHRAHFLIIDACASRLIESAKTTGLSTTFTYIPRTGPRATLYSGYSRCPD